MKSSNRYLVNRRWVSWWSIKCRYKIYSPSRPELLPAPGIKEFGDRIESLPLGINEQGGFGVQVAKDLG